MLGDITDIKQALNLILSSDKFSQMVASIVAEKQAYIPGCPNPLANRPATVYSNERLTKLIFPMAELLAHQTVYPQLDTMVKQGCQRVGIRWTVLEKNEETATLAVEILVRATVDLLWNPRNAGLLADTLLNAGPLIITEEDYAPLLPDAKGAFQKSAIVLVDITTWRD